MRVKPPSEWSERGILGFFAGVFLFGIASVPLAMIAAKLFIRWFQGW